MLLLLQSKICDTGTRECEKNSSTQKGCLSLLEGYFAHEGWCPMKTNFTALRYIGIWCGHALASLMI